MLQNEEDHLNCVIEINAGAGGTESCDWAQMLMRMYIMFAEKNGFKVKELDRQDGDVAGVKSVSIEITPSVALELQTRAFFHESLKDQSWEQLLLF
jgi:peptide chain release factor 2